MGFNSGFKGLKIGQRKKNKTAPGGEADKSKSPDIQLTGRAVGMLLFVSERYDYRSDI